MEETDGRDNAAFIDAREKMTSGLRLAASPSGGILSSFSIDNVRENPSSIISDIDESTKCADKIILGDDGNEIGRENTCETSTEEIAEIENMMADALA